MNFKYFKISSLIPFIAVLAVLLQPVSDWIVAELSKVSKIKSIISFVDALSTIGMLSLILAFVNIEGWKWKLFKWLIDIPNLNGRYVGKLESSYRPAGGSPVIIDCVLEIRQTASAIHINAYAGDIASGQTTSKFETTSEQLIKQSSGFYELFYIFSNTPNTMAVQITNHDGTARLMYYPDIETLDGKYYNSRKNEGEIKVNENLANELAG